RILRYKKLENFCEEQGFDYILTAHNRTDQLETVAMRLIKGSSIVSLRGIYPVRGKIIRPVLELERQDFEKCLKESGFTWSEDSTNTNNKYLRNYIRNNLFVKLKKIMPEYDKSLLLIQKKVEKACINFDYEKDFEKNGIDLEEFKILNNFQKELCLFSYWDKVFFSEEKGLEVSLSRKNISRIIEATEVKKGISLDFSKAIVCITKNRLFIINKRIIKEYPTKWSFELDLNKKSESISLPYGLCLKRGIGSKKMNKDIKSNPQIFLFNEDLKGKVRVSNYENGDTIQLKSGTKKISRLLQDFGIPSALRKFVPVIYDENQAVAVMAAFFGGKDRICKVCSGHKEINLLYLYIIDKE
ncbi:MAG: tRNA lysidine(34) synthetase TilS, partial [Sphaerochaetaceae bacterium]